MYEQLNRVVENLVRRIAEQERRLNKITESGIVMEHYGGGGSQSMNAIRRKLTPTAIPFSNLTSSPHQLMNPSKTDQN